jgi:hypothetical protein
MRMKLIVLLLGITLELSAASGIRILSECDGSAEVKATIAKDAEVKVLSSFSNGSPCFSVVATVDGKHVRGYVIDSDLDAVVAFEKARIDSLKQAMSAPPVVPPPPAPPAAVASPSAPAAPEPAKEPAPEKPKKPAPIPD